MERTVLPAPTATAAAAAAPTPTREAEAELHKTRICHAYIASHIGRLRKAQGINQGAGRSAYAYCPQPR